MFHIKGGGRNISNTRRYTNREWLKYIVGMHVLPDCSMYHSNHSWAKFKFSVRTFIPHANFSTLTAYSPFVNPGLKNESDALHLCPPY